MLMDRWGRGGDEGVHLFAIFRRGVRGFEVPFEVGLLAVGDLHCIDGEAALLAEGAPFAGRKQAVVAGVAQFLDLMEPGFCLGTIVRDGAIDEEEPAAGLEDARGLADKIGGGGEVMGCNAAGNEIESGVGIGEFFRWMLPGLDGQTLLGCAFADALEHGRGEIGGGDLEAGAGEVECGVAGAGGDIEGEGAGGERKSIQRGGDVAGVRKDVALALGVAVALLLELVLGGLLDGVHGERVKISRETRGLSSLRRRVQNYRVVKNPVIVALDVPDQDSAVRLVERIGPAVSFYKIGLQLFTRCGPGVVEAVKAMGGKVFLDLKFHDIPNTVKHSVKSACALGVDLLTIHLSGGGAMIRAAADGVTGGAMVLGVTVLTSSNRETLKSIGLDVPVEDQVLRLARLAAENGVAGIVASPLEVALLRQVFGNGLTIVTPGVRPEWAEANDQQRTMTPKAAMQAGADYLVIGRPITGQPDPREAAERILAEIA